MAAAGARAVMLYLIQIGSAPRFALARDIDPAYGAGLRPRPRRAASRPSPIAAASRHATGIEVVPSRCRSWSERLLRSPRLLKLQSRQRPAMPRGGGAAASLDELCRCGTRAAAQDRTDQAARRRRPSRACARPDGWWPNASTCSPARSGPGVPTEKHRPAGVRVRHGPQRHAGDPDVSRLPQVDLHLDQPRGLPRHPGREAAQGRRHRQCRRDADPRRLARRFEPHVSRSARSRAGPSG